MDQVTQADRKAARALREILADASGFWHRIDDDGPLCEALAKHRIEAERRVLANVTPMRHPLNAERIHGESGIGPARTADASGRVAEVCPQRLAR